MIPKIIHTTWKDFEGLKTNYITLDSGRKMSLDQCIQTFREKNPHWQFKFWSDKDMDDYCKLFYSDFYPVYETLKMIEKVDFFRYVGLFHFGGLFLDTDCICTRSLDDFLNIFPEASIITGPEFRHRSNWLHYAPHRQLNTWAIFSTIANPHIWNIMLKVMDNCIRYPERPLVEKTSMAVYGDYIYAASKLDSTIKIVSESYISLDGRFEYMHSNSFGCLDNEPTYILHGYHGSWVDAEFRSYSDEINKRDALTGETLFSYI